jgi:rhamnose transport system permease protein
MTTLAAPSRGAVDRLSAFREGGVAAVVLLAFVVFTAIQPRFAGLTNLKAIGLQTSIFAVLALGEAIVVLTRNIDLSVGSVLGFAAVVGAVGVRDHHGMSTSLLILVCTLVGLACGLVNGLLVAVGGVPAIVATLGTLAVFRGLAFVWSGDKTIRGEDIPARLGNLALRSPFGLPWLDVFAIVLFAIGWWYLTRTRSGRYFYAVGSDPLAAPARGLPVRRVVLVAFAVSGAVAGLGGALYIAKFGSVDPQGAGLGYELFAISAVVVGGTSILGGTGGAAQTLFGVLLIGVVNNGLTTTGLSEGWQTVVQGAIIVLAVAADGGLRRRFAARRQFARRAVT